MPTMPISWMRDPPPDRAAVMPINYAARIPMAQPAR